MAKRPSFQFYPGDLMKDADLRACSDAARAAWMYLRCALHGSEEYGVRRWPLKKLAGAAGVKLSAAQELADAGVLKGADRDAKPYIFQANHAGKKGQPVTLVEHQGGPVWYDEQFVSDEYRAKVRGQTSRFGEAPKPTPNDSPKGGIGDSDGERQGYGASASTSTSIGTNNTDASANTPKPRPETAAQLALRCAMAIVEAGCPIGTGGKSINAQHPDLIEACALGATPEFMRDLVREALQSKHTIGNVGAWVVNAAIGRLKDKQAGITNGTQGGKLSASDAIAANNAAAERARTASAGKPGAVSFFDPDEDRGNFIEAEI